MKPLQQNVAAVAVIAVPPEGCPGSGNGTTPTHGTWISVRMAVATSELFV